VSEDVERSLWGMGRTDHTISVAGARLSAPGVREGLASPVHLGRCAPGRGEASGAAGGPVRAAALTRAARRPPAAPAEVPRRGGRPPRTTRGGSAATAAATAAAQASAGTSPGALHQTTRSTPLAATASATGRGPATTAPTGPPRERATVMRLPTAG